MKDICTFCKNKSTLIADFLPVRGDKVEIRACKKHYQLAFTKQNNTSLGEGRIVI